MSDKPAEESKEPAPSKTSSNNNKKFTKNQAFRNKKNESFQTELTATILKRLKVTDPTSLNAVQLRSAIPPIRVAITLRGLPQFVDDLWKRMVAIGTRPFSILATTDNYNIFLKCVMYIAETRLTYAQMRCEAAPPYILTSIDRFSEMQLRTIKLQSSRLPFPLVLFIEAIGNFTIKKQPVVPVEMVTHNPIASGAVSYMPTSILLLLEDCKDPEDPKRIKHPLARELKLPKITWVIEPQGDPNPDDPGPARPQRPATSRISPEALTFWQFPTQDEWRIFSQLIASMESKKDFLLQFDISTGTGSPLQIVRFPYDYDAYEMETLYYINDEISEFDEKLAGALMLGCELHSNRSGRFTSSYDECYKKGSISQASVRHAVIWSDK